MSKKEEDKEKMDKLKKVSEDLEAMIMGSSLTPVPESKKGDLPALSSIKSLDLMSVKMEADKKAEEVVESVVLLYLDRKMIFEHDYINQKMSIDKMTVSDLICNMKTSEHAIKKLVEDIDNGNMHARSFEVLSSLQKSKMEIIKHLAQFMVILETNYKKIKSDHDNQISQSGRADDSQAREIREDVISNRYRGTRALMQSIQTELKNEKNEDADFEDLDKNEGDEN